MRVGVSWRLDLSRIETSRILKLHHKNIMLRRSLRAVFLDITRFKLPNSEIAFEKNRKNCYNLWITMRLMALTFGLVDLFQRVTIVWFGGIAPRLMGSYCFYRQIFFEQKEKS